MEKAKGLLEAKEKEALIKAEDKLNNLAGSRNIDKVDLLTGYHVYKRGLSDKLTYLE